MSEPLPDQTPTIRMDSPVTAPTKGHVEPAADAKGQPFGRYRLVEKLGKGGMGVVWKAYDTQLKRIVALKQIRPGEEDAETAERFVREAQAAARLRHPNIIGVHEAGVMEGHHYLTAEYVEGKTLRDIVGAQPLAPKKAIELVQQVAEALAYAHDQGIVHRDVKPENILVDVKGKAFVMDFGLAKDVRAELGSNLTVSGAALGTPAYMSPEQARGWKEAIGPPTDQFSLGVVLYELLTGKLPFDGTSWPDLSKAIVETDPAQPTRLNPRLHRDLETICLKALEKDPLRRYNSMAAFASDLSRWLEGEPIAARPVGRVGRGVRWMRRNPVPAVGAAAAMVALFGGIGFSEWRASARTHAECARLLEDADSRLARLPGDREGAIRELMDLDEELRKAQALLTSPGRVLGKRRYDVNREIGEKALQGQVYLLARHAFSACRALDSTQAAADGLADSRVDEAEQQESLRRKEQIKAALDDLAKGLSRTGRERGAPDLADYVFEVSGYRDEQTVLLLREALRPLREKGKRDGREAHWTQQEQDEMTFAFRVLGRLGLESAVPPLSGMMDVLWDHALAVECGTALCNTRSASANGPLLQAQDRLGINSSTWRAIEKSFDRVPASERDAVPQSVTAFSSRGAARQAKGDMDGAIEDYTCAIHLDPNCVAAFCNRGNARAAKRDVDGAIRDFTRAIELDPKCTAALSSRGMARADEADLDGAIEDFTRAIDLDPEFVGAFLNRGTARKAKGDVDGASADFTRAINLDPQCAAARNDRGVIRKEKGDMDGAIEDFNCAVKLDPKFADAFCNRGLARQAKGDMIGAVEDFTLAIELDPRTATAFAARGNARVARGDVDGAIDDFNHAVENDPKNCTTLQNRGYARQAKGDLDGAIQDYDRTIAIDPKCGAAFLNRGRARQERGNLDLAVEDYDRAIALDPNCAAARNDRGTARQAKGDIDGAIEDYSRANELDPKYTEALINRGGLREGKGDVAGAIEDYDRAIEIDPKNAIAFNSRGAARQAKGDMDGAIEDFTRAINLAPKLAASFYDRGVARGSRGDMDGAIEDFNRAIDLDPKCAAAFYNRGNARKAKGDVDAAIEDYNRAIQLEPTKVEAHVNRGNALRSKGEVDEAIHEFTRVIEMDPKYVLGYYNRGHARQAKGDLDGAILDYAKTLEVAPANWPYRRQIEEALRAARELRGK